MRVNLIPMAGEGQRYKDAGYIIPKPLIDVDGLPMVIRAAKSLLPADKYIFLCREEHLQQSEIRAVLNQHFENNIIISVEKLTSGQASTCMLAEEFISPDDTLTIGACDNDMIYDKEQVERILLDKETEGIIWTFRNNPAVVKNPKMYGWAKVVDKSNDASGISCKIPLSDNPMDDHAVIGSFTFKKASTFFESAKKMIAEDIRINNEFYVDVAVDLAIKQKHKIKVFEVDRYICWGTPADYHDYNYWLKYFKSIYS